MTIPIQKIFQNILWLSRYMIIFPVIGGIFSAFIMILIGIYDVIHSVIETSNMLWTHRLEHNTTIILHVISSLDAFLIATVLLIFSIGLYELFICKITHAERDTNSSQILVINSLDQLKEKVAKVIIMVLIVTFFQESLSFDYTNVQDLLYLALAIFLVALAVYFTHGNGNILHKLTNKE